MAFKVAMTSVRSQVIVFASDNSKVNCPRRSREVRFGRRRDLITLAPSVIFTSLSGNVLAAPEIIYVADGKRKLITNLEDAREVGERKRDQKDTEAGPIIKLPSGVKFREVNPGSGDPLLQGQTCSIYYTIYKLNGYYLDSVGYGNEGKNDVGDTVTFQYGSGQVPRAIELGMEGMLVGGKRRILITPELGWVSSDLLPRPTSGAAERRLNNNLNKSVIFEVELVKIKKAS